MWILLLTGALCQAADPAGTPADAADDPGPTDDAEVIEVSDRPPWRTRREGGLLAPQAPGQWTLYGGDLEKMPGAGGDLGRALQALPAVQATRLRSTGLSLHGADPAEVGWVVHGVPLQAPRSAGTVFSRIPTMFVQAAGVDTAATDVGVSGAPFGRLALDPVTPDSEQWDATVQVLPVMAEGQVSAPLGRRGEGHAVLVGGRRTWIEPALGVFGAAGLGQDWSFANEDAWLRLLTRPGKGQQLSVTGLVGRSRNLSAPDGDGDVLDDRTSTLLAIADHAVQVGRATRVTSRISLTREVQEVQDRGLLRRDVRTRPSAWSRLQHDGEHLALRAGAELALLQIRGEGQARDPRIAPAYTRVAWRRLQPDSVDLSLQTDDVELAVFSSLTLREGLLGGSALGVRATGWASEHRVDGGSGEPSAASGEVRFATVEPTASLMLGTARTRAGLTASLRSGPQRDPLVLVPALIDVEDGAPLRPARRMHTQHVALSLQHAPGERSLLRVDGWARWAQHLAAWGGGDSGNAVQHTLKGQEQALGLDALVSAGRGAWQGAVSGSLMRSRRQGPGVSARMPPYAVPWSVQGLSGIGFGPGQAWTLGLRGQLRAGVVEVPLQRSAQDGEVVYAAAYDLVTRLSPQGRVGLRLDRTWDLADRARLTAFVELLVSRGPLGERLVGAGVDPQTGGLVPPTVSTVRDPGLMPWMGVRGRL